MPTEVIFPPQLWPQDESVTLEDTGTAVFNPILGGAITQRIQGAEPRMVVKQTYRALRKEDRAQLLTFLREVQGGFKSFYLSPSRYTAVASQWVPTEVFSNGTFANAGSGWIGSQATLSQIPGGLRVRNTKASGTLNFGVYQQASQVSTTEVYALRSFTKPANFSNASSSYNGTYWAAFTAAPGSYAYAGFGMQERAALASSGNLGGAFPIIADINGTITRAGDYVDIQYASLARCLLVDGGQNLLRNSTNAASYWVFTNASATNSVVVGPLGQTSAIRLSETAVTSPLAQHAMYQQVTVSSLVGDYVWSASVKVGSFATNARVYLEETQGFQLATTDVNLTTGATGLTVQAAWTHARAYVTSEGNGWWRISVAARKVSSANVVAAQLFLSNTAGAYNYASNGSGFIYVADASLAQSSIPVGYTATTTAANTGTLPTSDLINLKAGPINIQGALKSGQLIEINGEMKMIASDVDFNGLGLGTARIRPTLFRAPAIDDDVHVSRPFGKFILRNAPEAINNLGNYVDVSLEMVEVLE